MKTKLLIAVGMLMILFGYFGEGIVFNDAVVLLLLFICAGITLNLKDN